MAGSPSYSDDQLARAIAGSSSWRGVLRRLGLAATSSGSIRAARRHADRLSLDYSHFTRGRSWTDADLVRAVKECSSWQAVADALGLVGGSAIGFVRRHAVRLDLEMAHLDAAEKRSEETRAGRPQPDLAHLPRSGSMIAAAWFTMCGLQVAWPLEPCRYDLAVFHEGERPRRVQVKTTLSKDASGCWRVQVSTTNRTGRRLYTADEVDDFFIIDGDLNFYLIPIEAMNGIYYINLTAYEGYRVRVG